MAGLPCPLSGGMADLRPQHNQVVVEHASIARDVLVPDDQVGRQTPRAPVGVGLQQVAHQVQAGHVAHAQQHDGQVARDAVAPQPRLALAVAPQYAGVRPAGANGEDHGSEDGHQEGSEGEVLVEELKLTPGDIVADIGAGTGYFSRRLARKVGPSGRVLAVDIQPEMPI